MYVCMYVCIYACIGCVCMYICIYIHTHTYTHVPIKYIVLGNPTLGEDLVTWILVTPSPPTKSFPTKSP